MNATNIKRGLSALIITALALTAFLLYQSNRQARDENAALQQQLSALAAENETLSNRLQPSAPATDQGELLRLRGEVARLREQTNAISKLREENRRLQASTKSGENVISKEEEKLLRFEATSARTVNASKRLGLTLRMAAMGNNGIIPTDLASITNHAEYPKDLNFPMDTFELLNLGIPCDKYPNAIVARERVPRPKPDGGYERIYLTSDGAAQRVNSPDGNYDQRETRNEEQILELGPASMWRR